MLTLSVVGEARRNGTAEFAPYGPEPRALKIDNMFHGETLMVLAIERQGSSKVSGGGSSRGGAFRVFEVVP